MFAISKSPMKTTIGERQIPLPKRFSGILPEFKGIIDINRWMRASRSYPTYTRPNYYAFRPEAKVVLRDVDSADQTDYRGKVEQTLEVAGLPEALEESMKRQGLSKQGFVVGIKPNWMMALTTREPQVWTNPVLIECIVDFLLDKGYKNIVIFESDNMYSNFVQNHTVSAVLRDIIGVSLERYRAKGVQIVNLTEEAKDVGVYLLNTRKIGKYPVAPTLKEIGFLINVPKLKTHPSSGATLALKNMQGANFFPDKFNYLHGNAMFDGFLSHGNFWFDPTFELNVNPELEYTKDMFSVIDAEYGLDGFGGWKSEYLYVMGNRVKSPFTGLEIRWSTLRHPGKLIASRDPYKLEIVTMLLMNYNVKQLMVNPLLRSMVEIVSGLPSEIRIDDNGKNELRPFSGFHTTGNLEAIYTTLFGKKAEKLSWESRFISDLIVKILTIGEGIYPVANIFGWLSTGTDPRFCLKKWKSYRKELSHSVGRWWGRNLADKRERKAQGNGGAPFIFGKEMITRVIDR